METVAPKGYDLPTGEKSVTRFKVVNDTVNVEVSNVPNKPSKVIIGKYDAAARAALKSGMMQLLVN